MGSNGDGITETISVPTQLNRLFLQHLPSITPPSVPHRVVIDAIDECGSVEERANLVSALLSLSEAVPWIRVFFTSRAEPEIQSTMEVALQANKCIAININDEQHVDEDIKLYIRAQAAHPTRPVELTDEEVDILAKQANGLFIWCKTLFVHIRGSPFPPRSRLKPFLDHSGNRTLKPLYDLYDIILCSVPSASEFMPFVRAVTGVACVMAVNRPVSAKAITTYFDGHPDYADLGSTEDKMAAISHIVKSLHAVLYTERVDGPVRAYHNSFYDFVNDRMTFQSEDWPSVADIHRCVLSGCLSIMLDERCGLRFNICRLEKPVLNIEIPDLDQRINTNIPEALQYSSIFWYKHLFAENCNDLEVRNAISEIIGTRRLLFWLECLSVQNALGHGLSALEMISKIYEVSICGVQHSSSYANLYVKDLRANADDARKFVMTFSEAMESAPHVYLSAIPWLPRNTLLGQRLSGTIDKLNLIENVKAEWEPILWERDMGRMLRSIAFSPDGRHVTCGDRDGLLHTWNVQTGLPHGAPLHGHTNVVRSVTYSPNGSVIVSGSIDGTVRTWDAVTGDVIHVLEHDDDVYGVAMSPDCTRIASASKDGAVRRWNAATGELIGGPMTGHSDAVWCVAYSPDGTEYRVDGSRPIGALVADVTHVTSWFEPKRQTADP